MNFLKRFWRWLMAEKTTKGITLEDWNNYAQKVEDITMKRLNTNLFDSNRDAYDPATDEMRTLKGENESYFDS